jgi:tetratricopeptide (TPR) repeat protein
MALTEDCSIGCAKICQFWKNMSGVSPKSVLLRLRSVRIGLRRGPAVAQNGTCIQFQDLPYRLFRQVGDAGGLAAATNNRDDLLLEEGELNGAKRLLEESIPDYQAVDDKTGLALVLNDLRELSRRRGDLEAAETPCRQARKIAQEIDDKNAMASELAGVGDVFADRGELPAARKSCEESLALRNQGGQKQTTPETLTALARISIEEGHAADATISLRECKEQFHQDRQGWR